jgi:elongation factor 1-beta
VNVARWYQHIKSFESEFGSLPGSSSAGEAFLSGGATSAPAAPATKEDAEDDEIDLFGDDDEEDNAEAERVKAERVAEYNAKKANKPKTIAKVRFF